MSGDKPVSHLSDSFYTTPSYARTVMSYKEWQETARATQGRILSCGEMFELTAKHMGGGMYEVRLNRTYWRNGKPKRTKT